MKLKMSCLDNIDKTITEQSDLYDITVLYQFKGKDYFYETLFKKEIKAMINESIDRECKALAELFNLDITPNRMRLIIKKDSEPKTKQERLIYNLKDLFKTLAYEIDKFDISDNQIQYLGEKIFYKIKKIDFRVIEKKKPLNLVDVYDQVSIRDSFKSMLHTYERLLVAKKNEPIVLTAALYVDFMKSNIFTDENELIGLMMLYALLYKEEFKMFKYVSFFEIYNNHKDEFKDAYLRSQINWENGYANVAPLARIIRTMMIEGYTKVDDAVRGQTIINKNNKTDLIEHTILMDLPEVFTRDMIKQKHPSVGKSTIDRTLDRLQLENKIRSNGKGRSATWIRIVEVEKFDVNRVGQTDLFQFLDDEDEKK